MQNVCESSQFNYSAYYQTFNAHHLPPHKWAKDQPYAGDQVKSTADENISLISKQNFVKSRPFISRINSDSHDKEDNEKNH